LTELEESTTMVTSACGEKVGQTFQHFKESNVKV